MRNRIVGISGVLITVLFLSVSICSAELFPLAKILRAEKNYFKATLGKEKSSYLNSMNEYQMIYRKGKKYYRALGVFDYVDKSKKIVDDMVMRDDGEHFYPVFYIRSVEDGEGKFVRLEEIVFSQKNDKKTDARVVRTILDPSFVQKYEPNEVFDFTMEVPVDTYAPTMFDVGYRTGDLKVGYHTVANMISRYGMVVKLKIDVPKIVEIETPNKSYPCYKIVQTPSKIYSRKMKIFMKFMPDFMMPKIVLYYSVDKPHRMVHYHGYKDLGPASMRLGQVGILFEDYMDLTIDRSEPSSVDSFFGSKLLFERMDRYGLFE